MKDYTVTGYKASIYEADSKQVSEFIEIANDILESEMFRKLDSCEHHVDISRRQHCFNVAYYSFFAAKRFGLDARSAVRAGLLHDLFFYNSRESDLGIRHSFVHPLQALNNAEENYELNDTEREIIVRHMWPICNGIPRHPETYLVSFVDKYCAALEAADFSLRALKVFCRKYFAKA